MEDVDHVLELVGGLARFGRDDGYHIGPAEAVIEALENFSSKVEQNCGLVLQRSKTKVLDF